MTNSHDHVDRVLAAYTLGLLDEEANEATRAHLAACGRCRAILDAMNQMDAETGKGALEGSAVHVPAWALARWDRLDTEAHGVEAELYREHVAQCEECSADLALVARSRGAEAAPVVATRRPPRLATPRRFGYSRLARIAGAIAAGSSIAVLGMRLLSSPIAQVARTSSPDSTGAPGVTAPPAPMGTGLDSTSVAMDPSGRPTDPRIDVVVPPGTEPSTGLPDARRTHVELNSQLAADLRDQMGDVDARLHQRFDGATEGDPANRYEAVVTIDRAISTTSGGGGRASGPGSLPSGPADSSGAPGGRLRVRVFDRWTGEWLQEKTLPIRISDQDRAQQDRVIDRAIGYVDEAVALAPWAGKVAGVEGDTLVIAVERGRAPSPGTKIGFRSVTGASSSSPLPGLEARVLDGSASELRAVVILGSGLARPGLIAVIAAGR